MLGILTVCVSVFAFPYKIVGEQRYVALLQGETTLVSGNISENTIWTLAGSPYIVVGDVAVEANVLLTIEAGVLVKFLAGIRLVISGGLLAQGNATHKIRFTSNSTTPAPGSWGGITMSWHGYCTITNSIIEYASKGILWYISDSSRDSSIKHSRVTSNSVGTSISGDRYAQSPPYVVMEGLTIENNTLYGIEIQNAPVHLENSLVAKNKFGIYSIAGYASGRTGSATISNSTVSNNTRHGIGGFWFGVNVLDSCIVGNGGWGVYRAVLKSCRDTRICNNSEGGWIYSGTFRDNAIHNSNITDNGGSGIDYNGLSDYISDLTISGTIIANNSGYGVIAKRNVDSDIEHTTITGNGNSGVRVNRGRIHFSNLYDNNGLYEIQNPEGGNIDATYNWWGTTNETLIQERIYDYSDNSSLGVVSYAPFLNSSRATLSISTKGVSSDEPVGVRRDGTEVGLVHDENPFITTVYSGHIQPNIGTFSLSVDNTRIWDLNSNARYRFANWTGPAVNSTNNPMIITVTADSSITAFYETQYLTNFNFKVSDGTESLPVEPSESRLIAPNGSSTTLTSFMNQWLDEGTWTIKRILWHGNNVKPSVDPTYLSTPGGTWTTNCRVYLIFFSNSFKDRYGNDLYTLPSSFKLTFPNGTTSTPLNPNLSYYIQNGTITWSSIIWQDIEIYPSDASFDPANGDPTVNLKHVVVPFIETPLGKAAIFGVVIIAVVILIMLYIFKWKNKKPHSHLLLETHRGESDTAQREKKGMPLFKVSQTMNNSGIPLMRFLCNLNDVCPIIPREPRRTLRCVFESSSLAF